MNNCFVKNVQYELVYRTLTEITVDVALSEVCFHF